MTYSGRVIPGSTARSETRPSGHFCFEISDTDPFNVAFVNKLHEQYLLDFVSDHRTIELVQRLPNKMVLQFKPMADLEWALEPAQLPRELESLIIEYL